MAKYDSESIPKETSWIQDLDKEEAELQCEAWGISYADTLEKNRELLRKFVKKSRTANIVDKKEQNLDGVDEIEQKLDKKVTNESVDQLRVHDDSSKQPEVLDLVRQMHSESLKITMEAVQQVVAAISERKSPAANRSGCAILGELLRELRPNNGADPSKNVKFLLKIDSILESVPDEPSDVIPQILPFTKGRVREFWQKLGKQNASWEQIVSDFLTKFFTPDLLRMVKEEFLFRPQRENEALEDYVAKIRRAFKILSPESQETEIFNTVFFKITSETRTSLNSVGIVKSLQDIVDAAPAADAISRAKDSIAKTDNDSAGRVPGSSVQGRSETTRHPTAGRLHHGQLRARAHMHTARQQYRPQPQHSTTYSHRPYQYSPRPAQQYTPRQNYSQHHTTVPHSQPQMTAPFLQQPQFFTPQNFLPPQQYFMPHQQSAGGAFTPGYMDNSQQVQGRRNALRGNLNSRRGR